jgi:hypothetical protein
MTDRQTIHDQFDRFWDDIHEVGWTITESRESALMWWFVAWRTCEARQENKDSAGALRIVPAASP